MASPLARTRTGFVRAVDEAETFLVRARSRPARAGGAATSFTRNQLEWCAETSLLKAFLALEVFLEDCMALYVVGERAPGGRRPRRLKKLDGTTKQAKETFKGGKAFVKWNNSGEVIKRASEWLKDGEPFTTALSGASTPLGYLRVVRNAIAHESESAADQFSEQTRKLYGAVPRRLTPGSVLLGPCAAALGPHATLIDGSFVVLRAIAAGVVP